MPGNLGTSNAPPVVQGGGEIFMAGRQGPHKRHTFFERSKSKVVVILTQPWTGGGGGIPITPPSGGSMALNVLVQLRCICLTLSLPIGDAPPPLRYGGGHPPAASVD